MQRLSLKAEITTNLLLVGKLNRFKLVSLDWAVYLNLLFAQHLHCFRLVKSYAHNIAASASKSFDFCRIRTN